MKEIYDINIQRMNNGAHFTFVSNILARAEADTTVKGKASELVSNFKAAVEAFLAMPIADMAQAAKVLAQHIKDYKINTAGQLDKETGLLVTSSPTLKTSIPHKLQS